MSTLRARQKAERRSAIFRAAAALFAEKGYAATAMDDIAHSAGVSVPTIYAYYPAKADLIVAIYETDRTAVEADRNDIINNPPDDVTEAISTMILVDLQNNYEYLDNSVWREVVASAIRAAGEYQPAFDKLNERTFDEPIGRLLVVLQGRGDISVSINMTTTIALFSDIAMAVFHQQIAREHPWTWVEERIRGAVSTVVFGLQP